MTHVGQPPALTKRTPAHAHPAHVDHAAVHTYAAAPPAHVDRHMTHVGQRQHSRSAPRPTPIRPTWTAPRLTSNAAARPAHVDRPMTHVGQPPALTKRTPAHAHPAHAAVHTYAAAPPAHVGRA